MHMEAKQIDSEQVLTNHLWLCNRYFSKPSNGFPDQSGHLSLSIIPVMYIALVVIGRGQVICMHAVRAAGACTSVEVCHTKFKRTKSPNDQLYENLHQRKFPRYTVLHVHG